MSGNTGTDKEVILTVPFDADELDTVRLTLYGVAVRMGYTYEEIEDLKVALTEACNHALLQTPEKPPGAALRIVFTMRPAELVVRLEGAGCGYRFAKRTTRPQSCRNLRLWMTGSLRAPGLAYI